MEKALIIFLSVYCFFHVLRMDVFDDFQKWLDKKTVKHRKEFVYRVALLLPCIFGLSYVHSWHWYFSMPLECIAGRRAPWPAVVESSILEFGPLV